MRCAGGGGSLCPGVLVVRPPQKRKEGGASCVMKQLFHHPNKKREGGGGGGEDVHIQCTCCELGFCPFPAIDQQALEESSDSGPGSDVIAVLVVCSVVAVVLLVFAIILLWKISSRLKRRGKAYDLPVGDREGIRK